MKSLAILAALAMAPVLAAAAPVDLHAEIDRLSAQIEPQVIKNRRHLHQHPELSNREFETAKFVAARLKGLGLEVQTGVAHTGVVAVLRGGKPGPVVALRADMDALPVVEEVDLPFASKVRSSYDGKDVGVMHACGHDAHTAILLGAAEVLAQLKPQLAGTVKFIFQPAEESAPVGEEGGAQLMLKQGVFDQAPKPEAIFGLHVFAQWEVGELLVKEGGAMASADSLDILVRGKQTHGAAPWQGIDPIVVASQIVMGLQTVASRQMNIGKEPVIVTIGKIDGGVRNNIIPDQVVMKGTLRALDDGMRAELHQRVTRTAQKIAEAAGTTAEVTIGAESDYPVTVNDPALVARMRPTLARVAGGPVKTPDAMLGAEDFSYFAQRVPGLFVFLGARPKGEAPEKFAANHSPRFHLDEGVLPIGVRTLANLVVDYAATVQP
ncbi:amidohydrolase [Stagnimonas aquatica]|uniref:Amidohydrolase n=1 Tax=Stagnimonas aquatica TaxID=2689987 RepID=A0A3N0VDZ0_9GAMM|nr:amidohydrolase [Stagnimonas aquatica]ROH90885.1 amidohydrolase [Stagnimonas aquatica]